MKITPFLAVEVNKVSSIIISTNFEKREQIMLNLSTHFIIPKIIINGSVSVINYLLNFNVFFLF